MPNFFRYTKAWISALRLRTLPLSASGIILGGFIALSEQKFISTLFFLILITASLLQIISNLANDYGDYTHGTDNAERIGPTRAVQSGEIQASEMKKAVIILSLITLLLGIYVLYIAFKDIKIGFFIFLFIGMLSIVASVKYTVGKINYGYHGLGDIMVFLFFGIVAVMGTYFLQTLSVNLSVLFPASAVGLLSMAVLNINNMRDAENDKKSNKITIAVKLGKQKSKIYHSLLIFSAILCSYIYVFLSNKLWAALLISFPIIFFIIHLIKVLKNDIPQKLDTQLKILSLETLFYTIIFGIGILL